MLASTCMIMSCLSHIQLPARFSEPCAGGGAVCAAALPHPGFPEPDGSRAERLAAAAAQRQPAHPLIRRGELQGLQSAAAWLAFLQGNCAGAGLSAC